MLSASGVPISVAINYDINRSAINREITDELIVRVAMVPRHKFSGRRITVAFGERAKVTVKQSVARKMRTNRVSDSVKFRGQLVMDNGEIGVPIVTIRLKDRATTEMDSFKRRDAKFVNRFKRPVKLGGRGKSRDHTDELPITVTAKEELAVRAHSAICDRAESGFAPRALAIVARIIHRLRRITEGFYDTASLRSQKNAATQNSLPKRNHVAKEAVSTAWQTNTRQSSERTWQAERISNDEAVALRKNHVTRPGQSVYTLDSSFL